MNANQTTDTTPIPTPPPASYPKNFQAILDWCVVHRPDLRPVVEAEQNNNGFILLMTVGFESGRQYQHDHPEEPLNQPHRYLEH